MGEEAESALTHVDHNKDDALLAGQRGRGHQLLSIARHIDDHGRPRVVQNARGEYVQAQAVLLARYPCRKNM